MNKLISLFVCMTLILIAVAVWGSFQGDNSPAVSETGKDKQIYSTAKSASSQENSEIPAIADEQRSLYLVKEYRGHIGVFREGNLYPFQEIDVNVEDLPKTDQLLLANGIEAENDEQLRRILEDYES